MHTDELVKFYKKFKNTNFASYTTEHGDKFGYYVAGAEAAQENTKQVKEEGVKIDLLPKLLGECDFDNELQITVGNKQEAEALEWFITQIIHTFVPYIPKTHYGHLMADNSIIMREIKDYFKDHPMIDQPEEQ